MCIETKTNGSIRLDQFLKWAGIAGTGGIAKQLIQNGEVRVNGNLETRRGKKLNHGDLVQVANNPVYKVVIENSHTDN